MVWSTIYDENIPSLGVINVNDDDDTDDGDDDKNIPSLGVINVNADDDTDDDDDIPNLGVISFAQSYDHRTLIWALSCPLPIVIIIIFIDVVIIIIVVIIDGINVGIVITIIIKLSVLSKPKINHYDHRTLIWALCCQSPSSSSL